MTYLATNTTLMDNVNYDAGQVDANSIILKDNFYKQNYAAFD